MVLALLALLGHQTPRSSPAPPALPLLFLLRCSEARQAKPSLTKFQFCSTDSMNSQPGRLGASAQEYTEKMKAKAVGKVTHAGMPGTSAGSAAFSNPPRAGGGEGAHRPVMTGAPGCLIRPGRALEEPQGEPPYHRSGC